METSQVGYIVTADPYKGRHDYREWFASIDDIPGDLLPVHIFRLLREEGDEFRSLSLHANGVLYHITHFKGMR